MLHLFKNVKNLQKTGHTRLVPTSAADHDAPPVTTKQRPNQLGQWTI